MHRILCRQVFDASGLKDRREAGECRPMFQHTRHLIKGTLHFDSDIYIYLSELYNVYNIYYYNIYIFIISVHFQYVLLHDSWCLHYNKIKTMDRFMSVVTVEFDGAACVHPTLDACRSLSKPLGCNWLMGKVPGNSLSLHHWVGPNWSKPFQTYVFRDWKGHQWAFSCHSVNTWP